MKGRSAHGLRERSFAERPMIFCLTLSFSLSLSFGQERIERTVLWLRIARMFRLLKRVCLSEVL